MKRTRETILFSAAAIIFVLSACVPAAQPTIDPNEVANQVATSVALTVEAGNQVSTSVALTVDAQNTQTAVARPTDTAIPSPTLVPTIPTSTPVVVVPPTVASGGGGGGSTTKPEFDCDIIRRRPFDNTFFRPGDEFDIRWTIVNTGTKNLRAGTDVKYSIGSQMTGGVTFVELPEMKPGDQYEIILDAVAPATEGNHVMTWVVEGQLCYPYAAIIVEK
ncbi:MAG TPA: NBR1-Ig-like domain-containing protein [Anaerolineales bacterium]|nr:NBR1-Ig-like domain-containing protein [Anaerolineales bacterium]